MVKIIKSFDTEILAGELITLIQNELKAMNLNVNGVSILFKPYPKTAAENVYNVPKEVIDSGLNTLVFDTSTNQVIVYVVSNNTDEFLTVKVDESGAKYADFTDIALRDNGSSLLNTVNGSVDLGNETSNTNILGNEVRINNSIAATDLTVAGAIQNLKNELVEVFQPQIDDLKNRVQVLEVLAPIYIGGLMDPYTIGVNETIILTPSGNYESIKFESLDTGKFTVVDGVMTGKAAGTAKLKVTATKAGQADKIIEINVNVKEVTTAQELNPTELELCASKLEVGEIVFDSEITDVGMMELNYNPEIATCVIDFEAKKIKVTAVLIGVYDLQVIFTMTDKLPITKTAKIVIVP